MAKYEIWGKSGNDWTHIKTVTGYSKACSVIIVNQDKEKYDLVTKVRKIG